MHPGRCLPALKASSDEHPATAVDVLCRPSTTTILTTRILSHVWPPCSEHPLRPARPEVEDALRQATWEALIKLPCASEMGPMSAAPSSLLPIRRSLPPIATCRPWQAAMDGRLPCGRKGAQTCGKRHMSLASPWRHVACATCRQGLASADQNSGSCRRRGLGSSTTVPKRSAELTFPRRRLTSPAVAVPLLRQERVTWPYPSRQTSQSE